MNFVILCYTLLFCGLTFAQSDDNATEPKPCYPDICKLLEDFGALTEKVNSVETRLAHCETKLKDTDTSLKDSETKLNHTVNRLQDSENQILELQHKGTATSSTINSLNFFCLFLEEEQILSEQQQDWEIEG